MSNAPTIRYVIFDILGDLKQVYDDAALSPFKIFYWICICINWISNQDNLNYHSKTTVHVYRDKD